MAHLLVRCFSMRTPLAKKWAPIQPKWAPIQLLQFVTSVKEIITNGCGIAKWAHIQLRQSITTEKERFPNRGDVAKRA